MVASVIEVILFAIKDNLLLIKYNTFTYFVWNTTEIHFISLREINIILEYVTFGSCLCVYRQEVVYVINLVSDESRPNKILSAPLNLFGGLTYH